MNALIDDTIERVEQLYTALTGSRPPMPDRERTAIPSEIDPLVHVQEQLGRMVSAAERLRPPMPGVAPEWIPRAIVWSRDGELVLAVDLPGVAREDVQIRVEPRVLTVTGRRNPPAGSVIASDAQLGRFARSFLLAAVVSPEHVSARLDAGVLTIRTHRDGTEPSQISITS